MCWKGRLKNMAKNIEDQIIQKMDAWMFWAWPLLEGQNMTKNVEDRILQNMEALKNFKSYWSKYRINNVSCRKSLDWLKYIKDFDLYEQRILLHRKLYYCKKPFFVQSVTISISSIPSLIVFVFVSALDFPALIAMPAFIKLKELRYDYIFFGKISILNAGHLKTINFVKGSIMWL